MNLTRRIIVVCLIALIVWCIYRLTKKMDRLKKQVEEMKNNVRKIGKNL
jgi:hypothetical protein